MLLKIIPFILLMPLMNISAQAQQWINFNTSNSPLPTNSIHSITIENDTIRWIGTWGSGLVKFDGSNWTFYNTHNSPLPHDIIYEVVIDKDNRKWIATQGGGVAVFDDTSWVVYDTSNSGLTHNTIYAVAIDSQNNKWIGTWGSGAFKFDGINWINFSRDNTIIPNVKIPDIFIDSRKFKWIGSAAGLLSFNDSTWTLYDETNSPLGRWAVYSMTSDKNDHLWVGFKFNGVAKFDGKSWSYLQL